MSVIPYGHQDIDDADIAAVVDVLRSDWLTQGPAITRFERAIADFCGVRHAVAVCNATAALHLACRALGLGPGDELWTSPNTFVASANCALYCGAGVDFVDIDPSTLNMSPDALEAKLDAATHKPKVVVPVHFGGQPCEMDRISRLSESYGVEVIEDAAHAVGASYQGIPVGACRHSAITVFSFHPVKIMTTGEGGMLLTNRDDLYEKLLLLRTHGITRDAAQMTRPSEGAWYYEQIDLGFNYRITDLQAALGLSQLSRMDRFIARRRELAARYRTMLADLPLDFQEEVPGALSAHHLFPVRINVARAGIDRATVFARMREADIGVNVHYIPVHTQPWYQRMGFRRGQFPAAERYYDEAISLPLYYGLSNAQQDRVGAELRRALQA
jgi:UDP-4-amino-4,6-dideoxy-N-acetyl-beta-L-altrosamine transaminase